MSNYDKNDIIDVLRDEVKAWRRCADIDNNDFEEEPLLLQHAFNMRAATDAAGALEDK